MRPDAVKKGLLAGHIVWLLPGRPPTREEDLPDSVKREWGGRLRVGRLELALGHAGHYPTRVAVGEGDEVAIERSPRPDTYSAAVQIIEGNGRAALMNEARKVSAHARKLGLRPRRAYLILGPEGELEKHNPDLADSRWAALRFVRARDKKTRDV